MTGRAAPPPFSQQLASTRALFAALLAVVVALVVTGWLVTVPTYATVPVTGPDGTTTVETGRRPLILVFLGHGLEARP